jgi:hypothetical protein
VLLKEEEFTTKKKKKHLRTWKASKRTNIDPDTHSLFFKQTHVALIALCGLNGELEPLASDQSQFHKSLATGCAPLSVNDQPIGT